MISKNEILNLAHLARLDFKDEDLPKLTQDIGNLMKFAEKVAKHDCPEFSRDCLIRDENFCEDNIDYDYDICSREEILSGGISKDGFFFIKK